MSKRRHEDDDFVNVLRQKHKEDPILKQQAAQNTFLMLMNAQKQNKNTNNHHVMDELACEWCQKETKANRCHFCEKGMCVNCLQECIACLESYCSACYTIDYSHAYERVLCLSCKNG